MLAVFAVFFAVAFPLAPTPTAVRLGKAADFNLMLLAATLVFSIRMLALAMLRKVADSIVAQPVSVIKLTCTRLC